MKNFKSIFTAYFFAILTGCGNDSESSSSQLNNDADIGTFHVGIDGVFQFDHTGKRADGFNYRHDYWEFKANGAKLRMAGRFPDDLAGVEQASIDLEYNNVYLEFMFMIDGKNTRVSCKADQEPSGQIKRTINDDLSNSGSFNIELVLCRNTYTSEELNDIVTPVLVKGWFENTPNKESLF